MSLVVAHNAVIQGGVLVYSTKWNPGVSQTEHHAAALDSMEQLELPRPSPLILPHLDEGEALWWVENPFRSSSAIDTDALAATDARDALDVGDPDCPKCHGRGWAPNGVLGSNCDCA